MDRIEKSPDPSKRALHDLVLGVTVTAEVADIFSRYQKYLLSQWPQAQVNDIGFEKVPPTGFVIHIRNFGLTPADQSSELGTVFSQKFKGQPAFPLYPSRLEWLPPNDDFVVSFRDPATGLATPQGGSLVSLVADDAIRRIGGRFFPHAFDRPHMNLFHFRRNQVWNVKALLEASHGISPKLRQVMIEVRKLELFNRTRDSYVSLKSFPLK